MMKLTTQEIQITKGDIMMDEIISQIKKQQDINFMNVKDQILIADLALAVDAENNSRYIFHYLHSLDRFFINSADYVYEGERLFGIPEHLSVVDSKRDGYEKDSSIVISRDKLLDYYEYVKNKITDYFNILTAADLLQKPQGSEYTRLEIILGQFRHLMWHVGFSSAVALVSNKEWDTYKGLNAFGVKG